jgi:O-antigen/teichoic acid export membrane protein
VTQAGAPSQLSGISALRGGLWSAFSRFLPQTYTLVISVVAARELGPALMGEQSFIAFVESAAVIFVAGGLPVTIMRFVGAAGALDDGAAVRQVVRRTALAASVLGAAATLVLVMATQGQELRASWVLAAVTVGILVLHTVPANALRGLHHWGASTTPGLVTGALSVVAMVSLLVAGFGVTAMFATEAVAAAVNLLVVVLLLRRHSRRLGTGHDALARRPRRMLRFAVMQWATVSVSFIVTSRSEFFVLVHYAPAPTLAYYSIGVAAAQVLFLMVEAGSNAVTPTIAGLSALGARERVSAVFARGLRFLLYVGLPLTALSIVLAPHLIRLVYGPAYEGAVPVFTTVVVVLPVVAASYLSVAALSALGRLRAPLLWNSLAAVSDVLVAFWLVPGHAAVGAAVANTVARLIAAVPLTVLATRLLRVPAGTWRLAVRIAVTSALAAVAARAVLPLVPSPWLGTATSGMVFLVAYLGVGSVTRPLDRHDAAWVLAHAGETVARRTERLVRAMAQ